MFFSGLDFNSKSAIWASAKSFFVGRAEVRDRRIYADFAQRLIGMARKLYANDSFGVHLKETVYALDDTTIDLCLSVFPWAPFRSAKAAVKLHTLLDLRGNIRAFITALYRCRWQVERFFQWIKQHLRIKQFYGISENA